MPKQIIIAEQHQIAAVFSEDQIQELVVATGNQQVSDIYLGTVENVIPGIDAAFVNIGDAERNGFMHVSDLGPLRLRKSAGAITELLEPQQTVLVQVMKEPTGSKGPRLTGNISLPGRYLVLMPDGRGVNLSRRIKNETERSRLRALAILIKPPGMGLLVRTEAEGKGEEAIMEDLEYLQKQWEYIQQQAMTTKAPALLNRDDDFIQRVLRDIFTNDVNRIVVDSVNGVKRVKQHLTNWGGGRTPEGVLIDRHNDRTSILEFFRVNAAIREALKPRVDLPSGGYIVIEPTEALTVIDVNSGSFTRSSTARETVLWTNYEAATEIARQLRLRNIGGVIIVDFIDMDSRRDRLQLLERFDDALRADKARPQIAQLSELGLVELTRKRQGKNIYELFGEECPTCNGLGHTVKLPGEIAQVEVSEKVIPSIPTVSSRPLEVREREKEKEREEEAEILTDVEAEEAAMDLESYSHPSYQDPRRRRRRIRELEPISINKGKPRSLIGNGQRSDYDSDGYLGIPAEASDRPLTRTISRRDTTPPERVVVEMTPIEQEVYALMGISPLLHLNQEIKDPRSVIAIVREPSEMREVQEPKQLVISELMLEPKTEEFTSIEPFLEEPEPIPLLVSEPEHLEPENDLEETEETIDPPASLLSLAPIEEPESQPEPDESEDNLLLVRRRRRRSSARED